MPIELPELERKQQELDRRLGELEDVRTETRGELDTLFSRLPQNQLTSTDDRHLHKRLGRLNVRAPRELTIGEGSAGAGQVAMTRGYHTIDTASDASSDDLAGILHGRPGEMLVIQPANDARTIVVKHNDTSEGTDGNRIFLNAGADITLEGVEDLLALMYDPAADSAKGAWRDYPLTFGGGLGFCYDYLVMSGWVGTEGQTITIPDSTETFQVYSTIGGAISAANTANTAGKTFSIGVCPGTYNESISWPNSAAGNTYSALLIRGLGASDSHDDFDQVYWSTTSAGISPIELDASGPVGMQIENLVFNAVAGQPAIDWSAGINLSGHAISCEFRDPVEMETAGFWFHHCEFAADFDGEDSDDVFFLDCHFGTNAGVDLRGDNFSGVTIIGCDFVKGAGTTSSIQLDGGAGIQIIGNNFSHSGSLSDCITIDNNAVARTLHEILIEDNIFGYRPADGGALIRVTTETSTSSEEIWNVVITGNTFSQTFSTGSATTAWIKLTGNATNKVFGITVAHNAFGSSGGQGNTIEDQTGFTVLADYLERSILGPNTLVGKVKYEVTNGANNLITPASADDNGPSSSGALPLDEHNLLDGSSHPDTLVAAPLRGSLIVGNATPKHSRLSLGADHLFLGSDGSDAVYRTVGWDAILSPTGSNDAARIQTVIDAGARKILLLDGTWDVSDQNVTFATGTEIFGQSRKAAILDFGTTGFRVFVMAADTFLGNVTVANVRTDGQQAAVEMGSGYCVVWNVDFSSTSGNGLIVVGGTSTKGHVVDCIFQGVPDTGTGQLTIDQPAFFTIRNCGFLGAAAAGSAILNGHFGIGGEFFPRPNIVITGCYGTTQCGQGWLYDGAAGRESTFTISGNSIAQAGANAPMAIDISKAIAVISGNSFVVPTGQASGAAMINVSGGKAIIENNRLDANSTRADIIDITASGGHSIAGNLIRGTSTNAIHLAGSGDSIVVSSNNCPGGDIRVAAGSTGNVVGFNIVNAIIADTLLNQVGLNVVGV